MAKMDTHGVSEKEGKAWGKGEFANMPKEVKMQQYPKGHRGLRGELDDTITGVDDWSAQMESKRDKYLSNQH